MQTKDKSRMVAKVLREVLAAERFETLADLADAVKTRCARLKLRPTADDITAALSLVQSNRRLVERCVPVVAVRREAPRELSPADASAALEVAFEKAQKRVVFR